MVVFGTAAPNAIAAQHRIRIIGTQKSNAIKSETAKSIGNFVPEDGECSEFGSTSYALRSART
jgi:hypothetical protein